MNEFPLMFPDWGTHDRKPVMIGVDDSCRMVSIRDATPAEQNDLAANWPAYLEQRKQWLAWAWANLKPAKGPQIMGAIFPNYSPSTVDIEWLLNYQTK